MSTARRAVAFVAVAAAALAAAPWFAGSAGAVGDMQTAVWWRAQPDGGALPAPPEVPAGGAWVASDPTGTSAVSAIRFDLAAGESAPTLALPVARLTAPPSTPAAPQPAPVEACPAISAWKPGGSAPGSWSARPAYDCSKGSVPGQLSTDQKTMLFDLASLPPTGKIDVVLVPGAPQAPASVVPALPLSPVFDLAFKPPQAADVAVTVNSAPPPPPPVPYVPRTAPAAAALSDPLSTPLLRQAPLAPSPPAPPVAASGSHDTVTAIVPSVMRRVIHLASAPLNRTTRQLAISILVGLAIWAWQLHTGDAFGLAGSDAAPTSGQTGLRRFTTGERLGRPPSLR